MRLVLCGLSAVLLSGCSWLGGFGSSGKSYNQKYMGATYGHQAKAPMRQGMNQNPCVIYSPVQPVPHGCDPAQVTLATGAGGYGAQGAPSYATAGYGSHANSAGQQTYQHGPRLKKPRLRGSLSLGVEKSYKGTQIESGVIPGLDVGTFYNPDDFAEGRTEGSVADGLVSSTVYSGTIEDIVNNPKAFDDVHRTPAKIALGLEYIVSPKITAFMNAGYVSAEGTDNPSVEVIATQTKTESVQAYDDMGAPNGPPTVNIGFIPNQTIANFVYDYSDLRRYDLEVGARKYFNPVIRDNGHRTLTPFVGVSAGVSHVNSLSAKIGQEQLFYERAFEGYPNPEAIEFYDVPYPDTVVDIYDSEWLPQGSLTAGMEWQVTPKTAIALETGVKYEKARDYVNGVSGDDNVSIPVTLRGSFNF